MLTDQDFQLDYNENPYVKFNYSSFNLNKYEQDKFVTISLNQNQNKENEKREPLETMEHLGKKGFYNFVLYSILVVCKF